MKLLYEVIMGRGQRIRDCICGTDKQCRQKRTRTENIKLRSSRLNKKLAKQFASFEEAHGLRVKIFQLCAFSMPIVYHKCKWCDVQYKKSM